MKLTPRSLFSLKTAAMASLAALTGGTTAVASPLISVGDRGAIYFNGSVTLRADDNVFLNANNEESDIIFIFSPGIEFTYGSDAIWNFSAYYREDIYRYTDNTELNTNNSNVFLNADYSDGRVDASFDASYQRLVQSSFDVSDMSGILVERDVYRIGSDAEYDLTQLIDVGAGISYQETNFKRREFRDTEVISVPVDLYYNWRPTIDLSAGYRFRDNNTRGTGLDSQDHFFNVGMRGEITPAILGIVKVGYQERQFKDSGAPDDRDGLAFNGQAVWDATERINLSLLANRDLTYSARGNTIQRTGGGPRMDYLFTELFTGSAGLHYQESRYHDGALDGRKDEKWTADIGLGYSPNDYVELAAAYIYTNNESNRAYADLDRNIFQLTASLRY